MALKGVQRPPVVPPRRVVHQERWYTPRLRLTWASVLVCREEPRPSIDAAGTVLEDADCVRSRLRAAIDPDSAHHGQVAGGSVSGDRPLASFAVCPPTAGRFR